MFPCEISGFGGLVRGESQRSCPRTPPGSTSPPAAFRVQGTGCRVQGSGFRVQGAGFRVQGSGFRVQGSGFRVQGFRFQVSGFWWKGRSSTLAENHNQVVNNSLPTNDGLLPHPHKKNSFSQHSRAWFADS